MNEDLEIKRWLDEMDTRRAGAIKKDTRKWYAKWWETFKEDTSWNWNHYISAPRRNFFRGIDNLRKYRKLIWEDRFWDHYFFLELLRFKLKDMEENWGVNTHYVGDQEDKDILKKVIEDLDWMLDDDKHFDDGYEEEYKRRSKRAFGYIDRHHRKWWD